MTMQEGIQGISWPDGLLVMEIIRAAVLLSYGASLVVALTLAVREFAGARGRTVKKWHWYFAGIGMGLLALLMLIREPAERLLRLAAQPLDKLTETTAPNWPGEALVGVFRAMITTLLVALLIQLIGRMYWRWERRLHEWQENREKSRTVLTVAGTVVLRVFRVASVLSLLVIALPFYLSYFPRSRAAMERVSGYFTNPAKHIAEAVVGYLPDFAYLVLILTMGRYSLRAIRFLFDSLNNGTLSIRGFHPEWSQPTYRLTRTLFLVFLLMVSYPYLPGSKSQFFQGFSVFLGALVTFGSAGAIGNIVAGTLLTYTRAFKLGDMVTIGDKTGTVIEKSLLVTRLRTSRNEEVSIPNGNVLTSSVLNYSSRAATEGVVLTVRAGIGYDVDWRTVHRLMTDGALGTERIEAEPAPAVWQSELGDYAVNYELRAVTRDTSRMWETHSLLRQNVLDAFNRAGVEIMTPSILAHRDASGLAVPSEQFPEKPTGKGIAVELRRES
jgi:small-conductance mechanosensitive channel